MSHTAREQIDKGKSGDLKRTALEMSRPSRIALPLGLLLRGAIPTGNGNLVLGILVGAPQAQTGGPRDKLQCLLSTPLLETALLSDSSAYLKATKANFGVNGLEWAWDSIFGGISVSQLHLNLSPSGLVCSFPLRLSTTWRCFGLADKWLQ